MSDIAERLLAGLSHYTDGGIVGTRAGLVRTTSQIFGLVESC